MTAIEDPPRLTPPEYEWEPDSVLEQQGQADAPGEAGNIDRSETPVLVFKDLATIAAEVDAAPAPQFLIRPIITEDAYGVIGAEDKAGKSWAVGDMAVTVAAGRRWLGLFQVDRPGPVLVFAGEGSERKTLRRLRAIGGHYALTASEVDALPIVFSHRVPHLTNTAHLAAVLTQLERTPPRLVILDPLYLAARGADASQLLKMAEVLEPIQAACQAYGAALVVVHHWNQTGTGTGRSRFSGAGTAEWGRFLISMSVIRKSSDPTTKATTADLKLEIIGDEVPDTEVTFRRTVWADDPDDLSSPLHYAVHRTELDPARRADDEGWHGPTECMAALRHFFEQHPDEELSKNAVKQRMQALDISYRGSIIGDALERLAVEQTLDVRNGPRNARLFRRHTPPENLEL